MPPADPESPDENSIRFRDYAGVVLWPATPTALTDTTICPACFTPLTAITCRKCGLDLSHPAAHDLATLSREVAETLANRIEVIGRIRYETAHPVATAKVPDPDPATAATASPAPAPAPAPEPTRAPASVPALATNGKPRRSSVQVALLVVAVSLLSIFAIFFLVYAFINYGIVWRSVIIAAITVATFVSASLLRRKRLTASAEALGVFALLLVYLDAFALRANDFFGLGSVDAAVYWGSTITVASLGFIAWHRFAAMRSASVVGWAGLAIGTGILAWGLAEGAEPATRAFIGFSAASLTTLSHVLISRPPFAGIVERMIVLSTAAISLSLAFLVSWAVGPDNDWAGAMACIAVAILALLHSALPALGREPGAAVRVFGHIFAVIGGISAAAAASTAAVRVASGDSGFTTFVPAVASVSVVLLLEVATHRLSERRLRPAARSAAWGAFIVFSLTALVPLVDALAPLGRGVVRAIDQPLARSVTQGLATEDSSSGLAVLALACVVALATAVWLLAGTLQRRGVAVGWAISAVLVLAVAQFGTVWISLVGWLLLAIAAYLVLLRRRRLSAPYRACLIALLSAATTLFLVIGWASITTWAIATAASIIVLLASRALARGEKARAALLGGATLLFFAGVAAASHHLAWLPSPNPILELTNAAVLIVLVAGVVLAAAAVPHRLISALDRRIVFWITGAVAGASALVASNAVSSGFATGHATLLLPQPVTNLVSSMLLFAALVLWVAIRGNHSLRPERIAASIAIAPAVLWVVDSFASMLGLSSFAHAVVPITAAMLTAAGALSFSLLRPTGTPRWAREAGVALVGLPAILAALADNGGSGWLVLILAAVTALLLSVSTDGLFSSQSGRRHLGWLALALATAGLWWRLFNDRVEALEPYVLPLSAALLVVAALIHRATARAGATAPIGTTAPGLAASGIALGGFLVGILPLAANSITGDLLRSIIIFAVSAVLLLAGSLLSGRLQPYFDAMTLAGVSGVLTAGVGRAITTSTRDLASDAWIIAVFVVLMAAAFGQARQRRSSDAPQTSTHWRPAASQFLAGLAIVTLSVEVAGFSDATLGTARAIATVALLGTLHVVAYAVDTVPLTRPLGLGAIALAAVTAIIGLATAALDPVELGSISIAIALLVSGRMLLASSPDTRSWRTLAPGVLVLLVPSLLATAVEPELWRLVGLGVASVTVLIVGAVRRLQAPFLLGLVVTLIHGFATFAPQIRAVYESQEWWLWAGLAGIVLLLLAIRYEKRIQNLKDAVGRIAALR